MMTLDCRFLPRLLYDRPCLLKRREIIDALRIGIVPRRGLELFAVGLERFEKAIDEELDSAAAGSRKLKAIRGEYGMGKTFFARWLEHRALEKGLLTEHGASAGGRAGSHTALSGLGSTFGQRASGPLR